ncbi:hypothetical protein JX265_000770 [Neoarthrinium moseri]|uniref:Dynamin family protein n=1 Tax=Neoarthrinium moseri TaxID=1658444 RepID=A0A9P9WWK4_9PEZI|nr:uncharacterized protein JN550_007123 [Neoarthrinium moseri]KAI1847520.1 hypothetical protein JX266_006372 [Neoarthrinium moseri]KAI1867392.1 hypothetical protein JN550_007123 [Neoarthrinium moseri]KAI1880530.1 hypothetical protein JX265_000770 [Neoarthrinium moseri]
MKSAGLRKMPRRTAIKPEPQEASQTPSAVSHSHTSESRSPSIPNGIPPLNANQSFYRSDAPSIETRQRPRQQLRGDASVTTHDTPQLMEMRPRHSDHKGRNVTPASSQSESVQQSFMHQSFTDIGMKLKACNDTLGELQQLGISHVAQLPELVMVGDQSAGKSSLMSGLAELDLPRSGGVCTRCPIHIRLSRDNRWSCTVSLQIDYDYQPRGPVRRSDVTRNNPFPPWVKKPRVVKHFKSIDFDERLHTEEVLRWAQVAILNPNHASSIFVPGEGAYARDNVLQAAADATEAQFSPNIVALEMKGPNLPDLSFYDLPGVFSTPAREEDEYLVQVVRNLSSEYICRSQAIILWALPMNNDPETSISLGLIRAAKAQERTVGVLTKADMVRPEDTPQWLSVLRGEKHPVGRGYFITSRPVLPNDDGNMDRLNQWEEQFFTSNEQHWPPDFHEFSDRCGVEVLKAFLSKCLGEAFSRSLPAIKNKVRARLAEIRDQLSELPELPHNVEHEVRKSLYDFNDAVKLAVKDTDFQAKWDELNKYFQACVLTIKPTCKVAPGPDEPTPYREHNNGVVEILDDPNSVDTPSRKRPRPSDHTIRATPKRSRAEEPGMSPVKQEGGGGGSATPSAWRTTPMPGGKVTELGPFRDFAEIGRQGLNLQTIRNEITRRRRAGLPAEIVSSEVYDSLVIGAITKWKKPLELYISLTMALFKSTLRNALEESMATLSKRMIFKAADAQLMVYIEKMEMFQRAKLEDLFDAETYQMYTTNNDAFKRYKEAELETLKRHRAIYMLRHAGIFDADYKILPLERMSQEKRHKERDEISKGLLKLGPEEFATEIEVAATVRGYYILAAMRFVESVTLSLNSKLFRAVASNSLHEDLTAELGLNQADDTTFARLMEEDGEIANKREQLKGEKKKLSRATQSIDNLEFPDGGGGALDGPFGRLSQSVVDLDTVMEDEI